MTATVLKVRKKDKDKVKEEEILKLKAEMVKHMSLPRYNDLYSGMPQILSVTKLNDDGNDNGDMIKMIYQEVIKLKTQVSLMDTKIDGLMHDNSELINSIKSIIGDENKK